MKSIQMKPLLKEDITSDIKVANEIANILNISEDRADVIMTDFTNLAPLSQTIGYKNAIRAKKFKLAAQLAIKWNKNRR